MLEALRQRDPAAHWAETADFPPANASSELPITEPADPEAMEPPTRAVPTKPAADPPAGAERLPADNWHARGAESPTFREPARTAQRDLPPVPEMYDPPPRTDGTPPEDASGDEDDPEAGAPSVDQGVASSPSELRGIEEIDPYFDYDPNPGDDEGTQRVPEEVPLGDDPFVGRSLPPSIFAWKASNVTHNPLYFEDVALERYGHTYHPLIQPAVSVGRFGGQLLTMPYHMTLDPPCKEMYPLGYYRPGEPAPKLLYQPPLNAKAAAVTAGFYTGTAFLLP